MKLHPLCTMLVAYSFTRVVTASQSGLLATVRTMWFRTSWYPHHKLLTQFTVCPQQFLLMAVLFRFNTYQYGTLVTGVRIKTIQGASGSVSNITYSNISLEGITKYGIVIEQDYLHGGPTGEPTAGVPIKHVILSNVKGTVASGGKGKYIICASCSDFTFSNVSVVTTGGALLPSVCKGTPSGVTC